MGCYSDNALCIDTTFNLFLSWVTDSSNSNTALQQMRVNTQYL